MGAIENNTSTNEARPWNFSSTCTVRVVILLVSSLAPAVKKSSMFVFLCKNLEEYYFK